MPLVLRIDSASALLDRAAELVAELGGPEACAEAVDLTPGDLLVSIGTPIIATMNATGILDLLGSARARARPETPPTQPLPEGAS